MQSETTAPLFVEGVMRWIVDCDEFHFLVDTEVAGVMVPPSMSKMGRLCQYLPRRGS